ncbi:hypothetical protein T439DRAFT_57786 [Meredithblackwellia eburnea MCA 4105]
MTIRQRKSLQHLSPQQCRSFTKYGTSFSPLNDMTWLMGGIEKRDLVSLGPGGSSFCTNTTSRFIFSGCSSCFSFPTYYCTTVGSPWIDVCGNRCYTTSAPGLAYSSTVGTDAYVAAPSNTVTSVYTSTVVSSTVTSLVAQPVATYTITTMVPTATTCSVVSSGDKLSKGATAGIAVGAVLGAGLLLALIFLVVFYRKKWKSSVEEKHGSSKLDGRAPESNLNW